MRCFGASVGHGVIIKPGAKITFPWRISIGDNSWIGEGVWLLNLDRIEIENNVCISQNAFLCTGSHDWSIERFTLITRPIVIRAGVWIAANVSIGPGVTIGRNTVVTMGSVVSHSLPEGMVCSGNPCKPVKPRKSWNTPSNYSDSSVGGGETVS
jgi:putative colanic acid biosynthesis acetyltransferase WcaF